MLGNIMLSLALAAYTTSAGLWPSVWGGADLRGLGMGILVGLAPLAVILLAMYLPGQLGRDIVAAGIGEITRAQYLFRVGVQVAVTTVLCEEFAFRGLLYAELQRVETASCAAASGAVLFGLWHAVLQYNGFASQRGAARIGAAAGGVALYAALGLLLAIVRQSSGGLIGPIAAHGVLDIGMFAGMYVRRAQLRRP